MKLFSLDRDYHVIWEPQALLLAPFAAINKRDKSKAKTRANNELAFVWFFSDIKSDYQIHTDPVLREKHIKGDLPGLPKNWKVDKIIEDAIGFYNDNSTSVTANILKDSLYVAEKLSGRMKEAVASEIEISDIVKLLDGVKKMPELIKAIQQAERAVLKEIKESHDRLGSKEKALFEDIDL